MAFEVIDSRNALSGAGSVGMRFSHLQSYQDPFYQEHFGGGTEAFWRWIVDESDAFSPEFGSS